MTLASNTVRFAVLLLPKNLRDRYREQWTSDLRDAAEAGIQPREIAVGALAFAATVNRPIPPGLRRPDGATVARRARLAVALSLSAAMLGLTQFARVQLGGYTGDQTREFAVFLVVFVLSVYFAGALVAAVAIISVTAAIGGRVRAAVSILVVASVIPGVQVWIDGFTFGPLTVEIWFGEFLYLARQGAVYVVAAGAVFFALRLVRLKRHGGRAVTSAPSKRATVLSAVAVLAVATAGILNAAHVWAARTEPVFSWLPGESVTSGPDGTLIRTPIPQTRALYDEWLAQKELFEQLVAVGFIGFTVVAIACVVTVIVGGFTLRLRPSVLATFALAVLLVADASVLAFMRLGVAASTIPPELLLFGGQVLLVAACLTAVGDMRFADAHGTEADGVTDFGHVEPLKG